MRIHTYGERDYAFGQAILTLRTAMDLTQVELAQLLGVSRGAVLGWEAGSSYPKTERLKRFIELGVQQQAFAAGREEEEIRALWHAAHQKVRLDEPWLSTLLGQQPPPLPLDAPEPIEGARPRDLPEAQPASGRRVEWEDALDVPSFYGRQPELALLSQWVVQERCRMVSVLGVGGIGKSALAVTLMRRVAERFEVVLFRSLRDAPPVKRGFRTACRCSPCSRLPRCLPASNDASASCWRACMSGGRCWCWTTWKPCYRKGISGGTIAPALRGMGKYCSPCGELLVSGDSDGMLRWWEVQSGECVRVREGHQRAIQALRISPDGRRLASCGDDSAIQVWDLESAELLRTLRRDRPYERLTITGVKGLTEAQKATLRALGAIEESALPA